MKRRPTVRASPLQGASEGLPLTDAQVATLTGVSKARVKASRLGQVTGGRHRLYTSGDIRRLLAPRATRLTR